MGIVRYINLDSAVERRQAIERSLAQVPMGHWSAVRFSAVDTNHHLIEGLRGQCRPAEKACFASHREALISSASNYPNQHIHILEDDALLGKRTYEILDRLLASEELKRWDLIFTDIIVTRFQNMLEMIAIRRDAIINQRIEILDLKNFEFAGLTSYVINSSSSRRLISLMQSIDTLDEPVDLLFRRWIYTGQLNACVLFPFTTTVSVDAASSQIQPSVNSSTTRIWDTFRNLAWLERDLTQVTTSCNYLSSNALDLESNIMGIICASMVSPQFKKI